MKPVLKKNHRTDSNDSISVLSRSPSVCVHARSKVKKTGAFTASSLRSLSHVNSIRCVIDWQRRMELVLSEHIEISSLRMSVPMCLRRYFLVHGSFKHSTTTDSLLLLATAFPRCLRLGIKIYDLGFLYPT